MLAQTKKNPSRPKKGIKNKRQREQEVTICRKTGGEKKNKHGSKNQRGTSVTPLRQVSEVESNYRVSFACNFTRRGEAGEEGMKGREG